jgi:hypothetical protein
MRARWWTVSAIVLAVLAIALFARRSAPARPALGDTNADVTYRRLALTASSLRADLYLPKRADKAEKGEDKAPLVVWMEGNDPAPPTDVVSFGGEVGDVLQQSGIAALVLSFHAGPSEKGSLRRCAADLASAIAEVDRQRTGMFSRLVLTGRGSGAWAAAMLALDRTLLETAGFDPKRIVGVVGVRGTYDLTPSGLDGNPHAEFFVGASQSLRESSPIAFVRPDAPPFLLLSGGDDDGAFPRLARSFARALAKAGGQVEAYVVPHHDAHNLTQWGGEANELGDLVLGFVREGLRPLAIDSTFGVRQRWTYAPPLDNDEFRADPKRIVTYPVDDEFIKAVQNPLFNGRYELNILPGKSYEAIDLLAYVAALPAAEVGSGDWLVVTNRRDERLFFARKDLETYKPVIVVGMDDETNLYRVFTHYRLKQAYSWKKGEEPMPTMIRPLGAFVHFRSAPPPHLRNKSFMPFSITAKSFHWVKDDPLASVREVPEPLRSTLIGEQGCLKCHSLRGAGARAHHIRAIDGQPYGAFALSLEEYPTPVLRRFLFDQEAVAKSFDVAPLKVDPAIARDLFALVTGPGDAGPPH